MEELAALHPGRHDLEVTPQDQISQPHVEVATQPKLGSIQSQQVSTSVDAQVSPDSPILALL